MKNNRAHSLDAFRGYAIVAMVLSGSIASGILPGWMYHAQIPPPLGIFDPTVLGITWVDLVFPFFLFAMGAAFPFSIGNKLEKGESRLKIVWDCLLRGFRLTFFAIFIQHMYPWVTSSPQDVHSWLLALFTFVLMFPMFMRIPVKMSKWLRRGTQLSAYTLGIVILLTVNYANGREFSLSYSNIIILVLANMSIFGSLIYLFTINNKWTRIAILPFIMATFLSSKTSGSWPAEIMNYSPIPWIYKFYYLKYLFIVIPGTIAGEYLKEWLQHKTEYISSRSEKTSTILILLLVIGIIVFNLYGLYTRQLTLNLFVTISIFICLIQLMKIESPNIEYWKKLFNAGAYLLMLGLFLEAYEGGIRKDDSTYSYYFVTAGLSFMAMIAFSILCDIYHYRKIVKPLEMAGKNPMIAYVATNLVVMPILNLIGIASLLDFFQQNAWLGFISGIIITMLASSIAIGFTKLKWFWRT